MLFLQFSVNFQNPENKCQLASRLSLQEIGSKSGLRDQREEEKVVSNVHKRFSADMQHFFLF